MTDTEILDELEAIVRRFECPIEIDTFSGRIGVWIEATREGKAGEGLREALVALFESLRVQEFPP